MLLVDEGSGRGKGGRKNFSNTGEVRIAYDAKTVEEHAKIKVRINSHLVETTVGRILLGEILPLDVPFSLVNTEMTKKEVIKLIDTCYRESGHQETVVLLDKIKDLGFYYATKAGISICIDD